jgi:Putative DNA-binding domain
MRAAANLATLERWMQTVVMHPDGAAAGVRSKPAKVLVGEAARDLGAVVLPSKSLTSVERLEIYAHMYYARLIEVMEAEYPTTRRILGTHAFAAACRRFVARNPSRTRTLNELSARFPDFLARSLPASNRNGLAVDVARIERAMEDVFDAPRAEPMTAAQFTAAGSDPSGRAKLKVTPALRLLALRYPANDYMTAARRGEKPRLPRPRATAVIVFRRGFQVFRRDQEPAQWKLLRSLVAGKPLAVAVRASLRGRGARADEVAKRLGRWFEAWSAAHLFVT